MTRYKEKIAALEEKIAALEKENAQMEKDADKIEKLVRADNEIRGGDLFYLCLPIWYGDDEDEDDEEVEA